MIIFFPIGRSAAADPSAFSQGVATTALDYVTEALHELRVLGAVDPPSPEDAALGLLVLNRILDDWNAEKKGAYAWNFESFPLTPNLAPHTIGPTGTFEAGQRPQKITSAFLVNNATTPAVHTRIHLRDAQWWSHLSVPDLATSWPTDLYYQPDWPDGTLNFWPVPTTGYAVVLQVPILVSQVTLPSVISLPPGYHSALVMTLAEQLAAPMKADLQATTVKSARQARARIFDVNSEPFRLSTRDAGMPGGGESDSRTTFNYRSRSF